MRVPFTIPCRQLVFPTQAQIPDKKKREARWDESFFRGNCLQRNEVKTNTTLRKRPASAGVRRGQQELANTHHGISSDDRLKQSEGGVRRRPSSANERGRHLAYGGGGGGGCGGSLSGCGDTSARRDTEVGRIPQRRGRDGGALGGVGDLSGGPQGRQDKGNGEDHGENNRGERSTAYSIEEREILAGEYRLSDRQEAIFREFVAMLVDFDTCSTVSILDDVFREAQLATGLHNFTGCGAD